MGEWLKEIIKEWGDLLTWWVVVDAYEAGVVLKFGVYARTLSPGLHWKWPVAERVLTARTCVTTLRMPAQIVVTSDGRSVVIAAIVKYEIRNVREYLLAVWDCADVLADVSMGAVRQTVGDFKYETLLSSAADAEAKIIERVRKEVNRYGFGILRVTLIDLAPAKTLRIVGDAGGVIS